MNKTTIPNLLTCLVVTASYCCVKAELPPYVYDEWRAEANTVLTFQTVDVILMRSEQQAGNSGCTRDDYYKVVGRIQSVERWQSETITTDHQSLQDLPLNGNLVAMETWRKVLSQEGNCGGWVGPSSPLLAESDKCYEVFLNCPDVITYDAGGASNGDPTTWHCKLAAQGKSLDVVDCPEQIDCPGGG